MTRLGILGGTFDPPHVGHLAVAVDVRHQLSLDRVLLVVANEPWQKVGRRCITPATDRLAMVQAAVEGLEGLEASAVEIERGGPSYTADTLAALAVTEPGAELFLVLGADAAAGIGTWERVDEVRERATVVEVGRPGAAPGPPPPGWRWIRLTAPLLDVSSTDLRDRAADGRPLAPLVPPGVITCIRERRLYRREP